MALFCSQSDEVDLFRKSKELVAYEYLWSLDNASFKVIAKLFEGNPSCTPSELVDEFITTQFQSCLRDELDALHRSVFDVRINNLTDYPVSLRDARHPVEFLYFAGNWDLLYDQKIVSIVGSRKASAEGIRRTKKLVTMLVKDGYTIMSGLAEGVDTAAHTTALQLGGRTIAVIGTPINHYYPKKNKALQDDISKNHLLISQVPFKKYAKQDFRINRFFFPERNATMSALSQATIIIEAGETSGTLTQAQASLRQGRKLFILENNFRNINITWPERFNKKGAVRLQTYDDFLLAMR